jgi:hypothetical protein
VEIKRNIAVIKLKILKANTKIYSEGNNIICSEGDTVHRPGDDPRKECEECGNARGSNVRYYPT